MVFWMFNAMVSPFDESDKAKVKNKSENQKKHKNKKTTTTTKNQVKLTNLKSKLLIIKSEMSYSNLFFECLFHLKY